MGPRGRRARDRLRGDPGRGAPRAFAARALASTSWRPDPLFMLDVGEVDGGELRVIELNAFSCSGLYACELEPVVRAASACAREA